ncbi:hypothetical protein [Pseudonocardia endophytica]|uniref:Uncharacterized protein n=1 Tax=Pseudonocardia endophytica TaxID=401976 RepID=A0A4R1HYP8_PSEEN|nr:hypothetical protein [Pseudonocardia endophytica]TCK26671.1 hypothetical protein EV378_2512 [Pseudonocardia endophytica]
MTRARLLCTGAIALSVVATLLCWYLLAVTPDLTWARVVSNVLFACSPLFTGLGTVIVRRGQGHRIGWLLVGTGVALAVDMVAATAAQAYVGGVAVPLGPWLAWADDFAWAPLLLGCWLILLLFPDGRVANRLTRVGLWAGCTVAGAILVLVPFHSGQLIDYPTVTSPVPPVPVLTDVTRAVLPFLQPSVPLVFLLVAACVIVRYRGSGTVARAQIRWLAWQALLIGIVIPVRLVVPEGWLPVLDVLSGVTFPMLPVVVAVAVLRYRLYDVDRLVSRTVSYALLTGAVAGLYVGVVAGTSALLHDDAGQLGVAAATLLAVSVVRPLRRRLQDVVDRRFDRARYDAHRTVAGYAERLRTTETFREADIHDVLERTVAPERAFLWTPTPTPTQGRT